MFWTRSPWFCPSTCTAVTQKVLEQKISCADELHPRGSSRMSLARGRPAKCLEKCILLHAGQNIWQLGYATTTTYRGPLHTRTSTGEGGGGSCTRFKLPSIICCYVFCASHESRRRLADVTTHTLFWGAFHPRLCESLPAVGSTVADIR